MGGSVGRWGWFWEKLVRAVGDEDDQNSLYEILKELIKNIFKCSPTTVPPVSKCKKAWNCLVEIKCAFQKLYSGMSHSAFGLEFNLKESIIYIK